MTRRTFEQEIVEPQRVYPKRETVIVELSGVSTQAHRQTLDFTGSVTVHAGDGAEGVIVRLRALTPDGPIIGDDEPTMFTVDNEGMVTVEFTEEIENAGEFAGRSYFLTVQQVDAKDAGTATAAQLIARQR